MKQKFILNEETKEQGVEREGERERESQITIYKIIVDLVTYTIGVVITLK